jgi:acetoacetyl-CoA synthetase
MRTFSEEYMLTMRRVEGAVKQILCGLNVKTSASVANSECLEWYRDWSKAH